MSYTAHQLRVGARRARLHADFIEPLLPEKLRMSSWVIRDKRGHLPSLRHCGTAACMAGWLPVRFPRQWRWTSSEGGFIPVLKNSELTAKPWHVPSMVAEFFRVPWDQADELCLPTYDNQTPAQVARNLRRVAQKLEREADRLGRRTNS